MIKIGITGSIASGKTSAVQFLAKNKRVIFSADNAVKELYRKNNLKKIIAKKLKFKISPRFKKDLKNKILQNKNNLKILEKFVHPKVRQKMIRFIKDNKRQKFLFFEIPLLIENNLQRYFDTTIFIQSNKSIRLKRFKIKNGNIDLFNLLNSQQLNNSKKKKKCDVTVTNNKTLIVLKKKLLTIMQTYE